MSARDILIKILTKGDSSGSEKVGKSLDQLGDKATALGKTLSLSVTAPLVGLGAISAKFAADANESLSKLEAVFGDRAGAINEWIKELRESVPATTAEIQDLVSGTQDLLVPLGMADAEAEEMTKSIVTLAGDLASFNNIPVDEALAKIRSGLVGQYEPLLQFGVALNAGKVKAEAFKQGIGDGKRELTASERALVSYQLILDGTSKAHGDAAKTKDSDANALKFLAKETKELATVMGQSLLPAITPIVSGLKDAAKAAQSMSPAMRGIVVGIGAFAAGVGPLLIGLGAMARGYTAIAAVTPKAAAGIRAVGLAAKTATPYLAALAGGYAIGTAIDEITGFSDAIGDIAKKSNAAEDALNGLLHDQFSDLQSQAAEMQNLGELEEVRTAAIARRGVYVSALNTARSSGDKEAIARYDEQISKVDRLLDSLGKILGHNQERIASEQEVTAAQAATNALEAEGITFGLEKVALTEEQLDLLDDISANFELQNEILRAQIDGDKQRVESLKAEQDQIKIANRLRKYGFTEERGYDPVAMAKERVQLEQQLATAEEKRRNAPKPDHLDNSDLTERIALTGQVGQAEQQKRKLREGVRAEKFIDVDGKKKERFFEGGKLLGDSDDFGRTTDPANPLAAPTQPSPTQPSPTQPSPTQPSTPSNTPTAPNAPDLSPAIDALAAITIDHGPIVAANASLQARIQSAVDNNASRIDQLGN
jgi:hypothetical protein